MRSGQALTVIAICMLVVTITVVGILFIQGRPGQITKETKDTDLVSLGLQLPDWNLTLSNETEVSLHSFRGRFLIVDLMATWCGACESENSELQTIYDTMEDSIWLISLGVDLAETPAQIEEYKVQRGLPWLHGLDSGNVFATYFNIQYIPSIIILDDEGYVRWNHEGTWSSSDISDTLSVLMES
ncbi:MAG: TlpA family protein disulfide reductase [Promethearchaeota archaeon]